MGVSSHDQPQWDTDGEPFDGRYAPLPTRRRRRPGLAGHGPDCSANPEIGCVCDVAGRQVTHNGRGRRWGDRPLGEKPTPFSLAIEADPVTQERRRAAFEAQERVSGR